MMDTTKKLKIGVLFGGRSGEHAVSLMSAKSVLGALNRSRYDVTEIGITLDGEWLVGESVLDAMENNQTGALSLAIYLPDPNQKGLYRLEEEHGTLRIEALGDLDVIFPVLHGTFGEDGTLQGLLEMAEAAYVGAGVLGSALAMDKGVFKDVMTANGIPVLDYTVVLRSEMKNMDWIARAEGVSGYPLFTKPANMGSSVGITKCRNRSDLVEGAMEAALYDRRVLIERGIENAREIEVSVLGNDRGEASIPGEIVPAGDFYSYNAKYHDDTSQLLIPAPLSEARIESVRTMAVKAYEAIDCAGMARVDFLLDPATDEIYMNEINAIPGFTQISMYPKLWEASGLSYPALIDRLIELALERKAARDATVRTFSREA